MLEIIVDPRGEIAIDNLEYLMDQFPGFASRAIASALKSEGYRLSQILKLVSAAHGVSGDWPLLNPHTGVLERKTIRRGPRAGQTQMVKNFKWVWKGEKGKKKRVKEYRGQILSTKRDPQAKLRNIIGYQFDEDTTSVDISIQPAAGSRRNRLRYLMHLQSEGYSKAITPRMRKMLFALGFPIKKETTQLTTPQRALFQPVFDQQKETIIRNIDQKFQDALNRYIFGGMKK